MSTTNMKKALAAAVIAVAGVASSAQAATVDTVLSLVIDVSGSISGDEYNTQMDGYANAFRDQSIIDGILDTGGGDLGVVAVNVVQFASSASEVLGFNILSDEAGILSFADTLDNLARSGTIGTSTNIADGINTGASSINTWLGSNTAARQVIDVSGDGVQNVSPVGQVATASSNACGAGNVVNGITIGGGNTVKNHYIDNVQCGTGSFTLAASNFTAFEGVVKNKLRAEITNTNPIPIPASALLLIGGLGGLAAFKRKAKKKS